MSLAVEGMSKEAHDEACCTYAALILNDAGVEVTPEKIAEVVAASGNEVEAYWPGLFAGLLKKVDLAELITNSAKPGSGGGPAGGAAGGAGAEEKKEEKEEEEVAEVVDGAGGLFGDDDGY